MGYFDALLRYFEFSGRTGRGQYWMFQLVYAVLAVGAIYLDFRISGRFPDRQHPGLFFAFVLIFHAVPQITVGVRRLHDIGKGGWWWLLNFVPFGALWLLVWSFYGSEPGANDHGDDPHDRPSAAAAPKAARRSPASSAAQQMLARMEARRGGGRMTP